VLLFTALFRNFPTSFIRLVSAIGFAVVTFIFVEAIYGNINSIAGYSRNDMYVFMLIGQTAFGLNITLSFSNLEQFVRDINTGQLDMILSKPLPHLLYISIKELEVFRFLQNFLPPIFIFVYLVNWQATNITLVSALCSIVIAVCGIILIHVFQFVLSLYTFWSGNSNGLLDLSWVFEYNVGRVIPLEGFDITSKIFFSTLE
jgi:ABC-2 type transport system permease protein